MNKLTYKWGNGSWKKSSHVHCGLGQSWFLTHVLLTPEVFFTGSMDGVPCWFLLSGLFSFLDRSFKLTYWALTPWLANKRSWQRKQLLFPVFGDHIARKCFKSCFECCVCPSMQKCGCCFWEKRRWRGMLSVQGQFPFAGDLRRNLYVTGWDRSLCSVWSESMRSIKSMDCEVKVLVLAQLLMCPGT